MKLLKEGLDYIDISGSATIKPMSLKKNKYFIVHHTAGGGKASDIVNILNKRDLGVQWIIDREGKIYKSSPGNKAWHVKTTKGMGPDDLSNSTAQGVEIIAKNDGDIIEDVQCPAALKLIKSLGIEPSNIYGHGEVSKHKQKTEGKTCKTYVLNNWGEDVDDVKISSVDNEKTNTSNTTTTTTKPLDKENDDEVTTTTTTISSDEAKSRIYNIFGKNLKEDKRLDEEIKRILQLLK